MKKYLSIGVILFVFLVVACVKVGTSPKGEEVPIEKAAMKLIADAKDGGYKLITTDELNKWVVGKKEFLLIDTTPKEAFDKIRIKGAVNSPVAKTEKEFTPAEKANILQTAGSDKDKTIVVYCGYTSCRRSHLGAKTLVENGFTNVYRFPGGIVSWNEKGYPTEGR